MRDKIFLLIFLTIVAGMSCGKRVALRSVEYPVKTEKPVVFLNDIREPVKVMAVSDEFQTIYFDFDSDDVLPEYAGVVAGVAKFLKNNPDAVVRITGHCDARGSDEYNLRLGMRRADAVRSAVCAQGVAREMVNIVSRGEREPVENWCAAENCHKKNRRVVIEVVK
jgi:outer membrane protein OmpA-like peptidoglycan-associated protein